MADPTYSPYEQYWQLLLTAGTLTVQVPEHFAKNIKVAMIKRKYAHRLRSGVKFNPLRVTIEPAVDARTKKPIAGKVQLTFKMHNLTAKDI